MTIAPPPLMKLLAHDLRWQIVKLLSVSDYRVNELVNFMNQPLNLVSYHLKKLREDALVTTRRSEADGRDTYYSLDLDHLRELYQSAGVAIHPTLTGMERREMPFAAVPRVLFVCTHNSARSQMAEGLMRHLSKGQAAVMSVGSEPAAVHPDAIRTMDTLGIDIHTQTSKGFNACVNESFDTVITVCDRAREVCPTFPGEGQQLHWGLPDPTAIEDEARRRQAFMDTALRLKARIEHFLDARRVEQ